MNRTNNCENLEAKIEKEEIKVTGKRPLQFSLLSFISLTTRAGLYTALVAKYAKLSYQFTETMYYPPTSDDFWGNVIELTVYNSIRAFVLLEGTYQISTRLAWPLGKKLYKKYITKNSTNEQIHIP